MTEERLHKVKDLVQDLVRSMFTETDWVSIEVRPALGCGDDEVLWVEGVYRGSGVELLSDKGLDVQFEIWKSLESLGEDAIPIPVFKPDVANQRS